MVSGILIDMVFILLLLSGWYSSYRAGWKDGRRWEAMRREGKKYTGPIPMGSIQWRDADDL